MNAPISPVGSAVTRPLGHPPVSSGRVGVLIVNLGTPEGTDYWSIRRYLKEFLSDRRVIETPRALWLPILQFILLRRPRAKGRDYDAIWNRERDEGPLKTITRSQAERLGLAARRCQARRRRLGDALRGAADQRAHQIAADQRLRPHSRHPALPAILRGLDRDGRGQGVPDVADDALAAGRPHRRALLRRSRLYRRPCPLHPRRSRAPRFRTRSRTRLLSRNSAGLFRQGRSLLLPLREDDAAFARSRSAGARTFCA